MSIVSLRAVGVLILLPSLVLITSCTGTRETPVEIHFGVAKGGAAHDLEFYIHDIELLDGQGVPTPVSLRAEPPWQSAEVALIDLTGDATQSNSTVRGTVNGAAQAYAGIRFTVGVPFALNHANPLTAAAPLNRGELFWTWQSGYKFLRADFFHLGSTGCSSASALRPPKEPCTQPNRVRVELRGDPLNGVVRFQLPAIVANRVACTGNYAHDAACKEAYATTGLQPETGMCPDPYCARQHLWTLE
jgi:uncharacterized repeat protein (TIGR04052 family)